MTSLEVLKENICPKVILTPDQYAIIDKCPICRSSENQTLVSTLNGSSLEFSFCFNCSHMYASKRPNQKWYVDTYYPAVWDQKWKMKPLQGMPLLKSYRRKAVEVYNLLSHRLGTISDDWRYQTPYFVSPILDRGQKILDIGCGYGLALAKFKDEGFDCYGIEATPHRAHYVISNGIPCKAIGVEKLTPETFGTKFDLVCSNQVIEHVCEPNDFMEAVKSVVDYGKHAFLGVPNFFRAFHYMSFNSAEHVHCFTPRSFALLMKRHGFMIKRLQLDRQIRFLVQRVQKSHLAPVYEFERDVMTPEDLNAALSRNLFQAPETADGLKDGNFLYSFKSLNSDYYTYNRFVDVSIEAKVEEIPANKLDETIEQIAQPQKKCVSLVKLKRSGDLLPFRVTQKNDPPHSFWSNQFTAF